MAERCPWCDEPVWIAFQSVVIIPHVDEDREFPRAWHRECAVRQVIGGVNHLRGRCTCCGGTEPPDPPDMTRREAALAACTYRKTEG